MVAPTHDELWRAVAELHTASFAWARACVGRDGDPEDVLQASYEKVLSGRARYQGRSSVRTWLFGVIRLTALEHRRRAWLRWLRFGPIVREPEAASRETDVEVAPIRRALAELPERQRQVVHLVFYEDLTVEEAAKLMEVSLGTARVHYDRGKKRLRELLTAHEDRSQEDGSHDERAGRPRRASRGDER